MIHVGLHSVETYHKRFGWQNKNRICRVSSTRQSLLYRVSNGVALSKKDYLPSVRTRLSTKITAVNFRRRLAVLCREPSFAEYLALGKKIFVECIPVPRVLLSANVVATESSATLGKDFFAECLTKSTR